MRGRGRDEAAGHDEERAERGADTRRPHDVRDAERMEQAEDGARGDDPDLTLEDAAEEDLLRHGGAEREDEDLAHAEARSEPRLEPVAADKRRVIAGAAGDDVHRARRAQHAFRIGTEEAGLQRARPHEHLERVGERARLLVDLFLHVVTVRTERHGLIGHLRDVHRAIDALALGVDDAVTIRPDLRAVAILKVDHAPRHRQQGRNIRCGEVLALADAEQERRTTPRHHHGFGVARRDHREGECALQLGHRAGDGGEERVGGLAVLGDEVRDDLGIGVRGELIARALQALADRLVVLDDAVVDDGDIAGHVRMGIALGRRAVRRPAGVRNTGLAVEVLRARLGGELGHATR